MRNNDSAYFKDWTTAKLKRELRGYDECINVVGCYGVRDVMAYYGIGAELEARGVRVRVKVSYA